MIDSACRLWKDKCGEKGSCWVYDNTQMAHLLVAILIGFKSISIIMNILALKLYRAPVNNSNGKNTEGLTLAVATGNEGKPLMQ